MNDERRNGKREQRKERRRLVIDNFPNDRRAALFVAQNVIEQGRAIADAGDVQRSNKHAMLMGVRYDLPFNSIMAMPHQSLVIGLQAGVAKTVPLPDACTLVRVSTLNELWMSAHRNPAIPGVADTVPTSDVILIPGRIASPMYFVHGIQSLSFITYMDSQVGIECWTQLI